MKKASLNADDVYINKGLQSPNNPNNLEIKQLSSQARANEMIKQGLYDEFTSLITEDRSFINEIDEKTDMSVLHTACDDLRIEFVEFLLQQPSLNINLQAANKNTALIFVCRYNDEITKLLLTKPDIDVNIKGDYGNTALMVACCYGRIDTVRMLIEHHADIMMKNDMHENAIAIALKYCRIDVATVLQQYHADMNIIFPSTGDTILMRAIFDKNMNAVSYILQHDPDLSIRNRNGCLAFHIACIYQQYDMADMILKRYGSINDVDGAKRSVLMIGCMNSDYGIVDYALHHDGINLNIQDIWGYSALMFIINALQDDTYHQYINSERMMCLHAILNHDPAVDVVDRKGCTALWHACHRHRYEVAEMLIARGAKMHIKDINGKTALDLVDDVDIKRKLQTAR